MIVCVLILSLLGKFRNSKGVERLAKLDIKQYYHVFSIEHALLEDFEIV